MKEKFWDNCGEATGKQDRLAFESHNRSSRPRREAHATFKRLLVCCRVVDAGTGLSKDIAAVLADHGFADAARPLSANKSGSLHDQENPTRIAQDCRYQVVAGFAGFFDLCDFLLTALVVVLGCGSCRKNTRQPGESCGRFLTMQAVTRSTSGISGPQRRNASPWHALLFLGGVSVARVRQH